MKTITTLIAAIALVLMSSNAFASNCKVNNYNGRISYSGCSATEMRAIQAGQFSARQVNKSIGAKVGQAKANYRYADGKAKDFNFNANEQWQKEKAQVDKHATYSINSVYDDGSKVQRSVVRKLKRVGGVYINTYENVTISKPADRTAADYLN